MITVIFGTLRAGDRGHHLCAVLGNSAGLVVASDHEAHDILQEQQRNAALAAQFDEVRSLKCAFRKQDSVVAENANRYAVDMRKAGHQSRSVERLEFVELGRIDNSRDHLTHIVLFLQVDRHDSVQLCRVERGIA